MSAKNRYVAGGAIWNDDEAVHAWLDLRAHRRITDTGCWEWTGTKKPNGYGAVYVAGRPAYVHRRAWELARGPIPEGFQIDHLCRVRACFNPGHLEPVTQAENIRRSTPAATAANRARCAAITHCPKDHPYDEENTGYRPNGNRRCKTCDRESALRRLRAKRAAA